MAPSRNRNPCQVIGVDLPAFLLSKNIDPEPVRVPIIPLGFCFRVLEPCDLLRNSLAETHHSSLATNHCRKIKNPASSAGYSHPPLGWLHAMLDFFLSCARKEPHYRIYFWPSLVPALGRRLFDPTVMPCRLNYPRAICKYTHFSVFVKSPR